MRREGEGEIIKKIKPSTAWHRPPAKRAKTSAGSGAHQYYTRVQGQCWGPFSTTRWCLERDRGSVDLTQSQDLPSTPSRPSAVHQSQTSTSRLSPTTMAQTPGPCFSPEHLFSLPASEACAL